MTRVLFKNFLTVLIIFTFFNFPLYSAIPIKKNSIDDKSPHKRALLIGISKYDRPGKANSWWNLNTEWDVRLLREVLIDKFRFLSEDISILQNEKATKENILKELQKIVAQTQKGDIVFLHFSGHGASIPDDNNDEIDGLDESLVPFDYVSRKDFSKNIRDDEIGKFLDSLKKKQPGNVTVSIDSCFSGTATRGDFLVRGGSELAQSEEESPSGLSDKNASYPKDYVFLSATNPRQIARETVYENNGIKEKMGAYTFGLVNALSKSNPRTTYGDLRETINDYMSVNNISQSPQVEGSLDEIVFDGTAVRQEKYVSVSPKANDVESDQAILKIGQLQGATIKSRYAIYAAGTKDPNDKDAVKIAEGEIIETEGLRSLIKLNKSVDSAQLRTARAFELQHNYADSQMNVILQNVRSVKNGEKVIAEFIKSKATGGNENVFDIAQFSEIEDPKIIFNTNYDVKIYPAGKKEIAENIVSSNFRGLILERKDGSLVATISENLDLIEEIKIALERENRFRVVKGLSDNEDSRLKVSVKAVLAEVTTNLSDEIIKAVPKGDVPRNNGGQAELKVGDYIMLEIENIGENDAYFTILNLTADGKIAPAFPHPQVPNMRDNFIKKGQKITLPFPFVFRVKNPPGEESFRVIATGEAADFSPLIDEELIGQAREIQSRGENPLNQIIREITQAQRGNENNALKSPLGRILLTANIGRGSREVQAVPPSWTISSFTYLVKAK